MPRKKPFSGKQKKEQLRLKREHKRNYEDADSDAKPAASQHDKYEQRSTSDSSRRGPRDRYRLIFKLETKEELAERKHISMQPYSIRCLKELESPLEAFYEPPIEFPTRPPWNYNLNAEQLEKQETEYFWHYCHDYLREQELSYCELNLETWRQLWRVLEMSDILLMIVDVRFASLHFNPILYKYVTDKLGKSVIVILNKCDALPPEVAVSWKHYLLSQFPSLNVVLFTSRPKDNEERNALLKGKQSKRPRKKTTPIGPSDLWNACHGIVGNDLDIDSWKIKIEEDLESHHVNQGSDSSDVEIAEGVTDTKIDLQFYEHEKFKDNVLTIGCVGYPNVGKSSVINSLMGKKVVGISRSPGHTKHFQTIYLTNNVRLCDCPGLVFPSRAPRQLQVLAGLYPISQLREPYSTVQYLAEFRDLPSVFRLKLPDDEEAWSAFALCDELASVKGFMTAKGARTDPFRAANWILRSVLEGKVLFYLTPPGFNEKLGVWETRLETHKLAQGQEKAAHKQLKETLSLSSSDSGSDEGEESEDGDESGKGVEAATTSNPFSLLTDG